MALFHINYLIKGMDIRTINNILTIRCIEIMYVDVDNLQYIEVNKNSLILD